MKWCMVHTYGMVWWLGCVYLHRLSNLKAHCYMESTGSREVVSVVAAAEINNKSISRIFQSEELSQLMQN